MSTLLIFLYSVDGIVFKIRKNLDGSILLHICKDYCYESAKFIMACVTIDDQL